MNVLDKTALRACTSCQMCGAVCASGAIAIKLNDDGFYRPYIDNTKCTDCSLCTKVCPKFDDNIQMTSADTLENIKLYAASAKSDEVVKNTTSGGIADLLAHQLYADGYKVIGVVYDVEHNSAVHQVAESETDLNPFRGSKYIQPYSADAFRKLVKNCRNENYAVIGLPCQIYAIAKYLERINKRDNCILIDLYCHGCPSMNVWKKMSEKIKKDFGSMSFDNVIWRSKLRGWGSFVLEVRNAGKRIYNSTPKHDEFFDLFFCNQVLNESCNSCKLRGTLEYTDLRLGDFWGPDYRKTFRGMSGVSIVTNRGQELYAQIADKIKSQKMPVHSFFPYQSWDHEYTINENLREQLLAKLKDNSTPITTIAGMLPSHKTTAYKIKTLIKQLFYYLPIRFQNIIRNS
ncbi:MAG: Coenzyme F420 hydrogenase/dehydrogenase, beta subunit C-terminal domain [Prevotella sp.]|nr:Coenzyme F420 hydrogenase/dehydrogenase, beta subunit C-terminal domain [Candidatus Prevotella equi]